MKKGLSAKSMKTLKSGQDSGNEEKALEFKDYIINACQKFNCPYQVKVVKETQRDAYYGARKKSEPPVKYKKITVAPSHPNQALHDSDIPLAGLVSDVCIEDINNDAVVVTTFYDNMDHLVELSLAKVNDIPRVLMQVLGLLVPYLMHLNKISITRSRIDKYTIYELKKMLSFSTITDICLDQSPLPEANYAILLEGNSCIRSLSLSRCSINDNVCKQIVDKLHFMEPNEAYLGALNLSSNQITDEGAKYIGEALRTNRHLRYLNLADNRITDEGARHILDVLVEFSLTYQEVWEKRHRHSDYLRTKQDMYAKCLSEFDSKSVDDNAGKRSTSKKKSKPIAPLKSKGGLKRDTSRSSFSDDYLIMRAELMTEEMMGPYIDPFGPTNVKLKNGFSHCIGNLILCYLNLSYNSLTYLSVKQLLNIVRYQHLNKKKSGEGGLIKVMIDGNYMPEACSEMATLNNILQSNISCFASRSYSANARRKSRMSTAVSTAKA